MQQIIYFFQRFKYFLFFLLLEIIALSITVNNLSFHNSKYVNSANAVTGYFFSKSSSLTEYLSLKSENERLSDENVLLKNKLSQQISDTISKDFFVIDSVKYFQKYKYTNAKIIKNDYTKSFNFILINKGVKDSVGKEMAVINSKGVIGITDESSNNYTRVKSILNYNSSINARLKNTNYFGSLTWNGKNYNIVQLEDIPRQAPLQVGDTIETDGKSSIFPEGILIGEIVNINRNNTTNTSVDIQLFNDMSNLGYVNVIKNLHKEEIQSLEN
jgi:rod shape-determining protein MreC